MLGTRAASSLHGQMTARVDLGPVAVILKILIVREAAAPCLVPIQDAAEEILYVRSAKNPVITRDNVLQDSINHMWNFVLYS